MFGRDNIASTQVSIYILSEIIFFFFAPSHRLKLFTNERVFKIAKEARTLSTFYYALENRYLSFIVVVFSGKMLKIFHSRFVFCYTNIISLKSTFCSYINRAHTQSGYRNL